MCGKHTIGTSGSAPAGADFMSRAEETFERIRHAPRAYAVVQDGIRRALLRQFPYVVYYRDEPDRIVVLAVPHGRHAPTSWQERT
jgi:plasmid stabilization system protein ParE